MDYGGAVQEVMKPKEATAYFWFDLKKDMFESFRNTFNIQLKYCMVYNAMAPERIWRYWGQEKFCLKLGGNNIEK